eukprot:jgi/Astpho2/5871/Aster-02372
MSKYCVLIEGLSSVTRSADIKRKFEDMAGPVMEVERHAPSRSALVEMKHSADAEYAYRKLDQLKVDGRRWTVDWANQSD